MRFNPKVKHADLIEHAERLCTTGTSLTPTENKKRYQQPSKSVKPIVASYVIPTKPKSYKKAAQQSTQTPTQETDIIEPTYTEIDWETKMQTMRDDIIKECKIHTEEMITKQVNKHKEKCQHLWHLCRKNKKNEENLKQLSQQIIRKNQTHHDDTKKEMKFFFCLTAYASPKPSKSHANTPRESHQ